MTERRETTRPAAGRPITPAGYGISKEAEGMMDWEVVSGWLATARNYWVATTRPSGRPHTMPVWGLWLDEAFYFSTDAASQKGRHMKANPGVVVHLESGDDVVILEGTVDEVSDTNALKRLADAYEVKYEIRADVAAAAARVYRLRPKVCLAWREKDFPTSATRWTFGEDEVT